jgi:hypothetical protein
MTFQEAREIFINRGYIEVDGGTVYEPDKWREACVVISDWLEQEPCGDCISRESIKQKLQEHHDFFVNAYGGFSNLPQNDKSRVDEITNCIAMVVNEPPVTPQKRGKWIEHIERDDYNDYEEVWYKCDKCQRDADTNYNYCPNCGCLMKGEGE